MSSDGLFRGWQTRRNVHLAFQESRSLCCLPAGQLQQLSLDLRWDCQVRGLSNRRVARAFALVIEAARRTQGLNFHRAQVAAGWQMLSRVVVEMQTGEGKTLSALLPVFARTLDGEGCHVMTANDYLAVRDAQFAESVLGVLGIRVGVVMQSADAMQRQQAYQCDVTYGTVQEFAFDYLRDRLREHTGAVVHGGASSVQRSLAAALVDEADSVLIDQACTPLILSAADNAAGSVTTMLQWADRRAAGLVEGTDFIVDGGGRTICLTEQGRQSILLQPAPADVSGVAVSELLNRVRQAVLAQVKFARDRDYVVTDERVQIVDESTGRILEGRKWEQGLQEAIEFREGVELSRPHGAVAGISVQQFLSRYPRISGMTGTAQSVAGELSAVYGLQVRVIEPHRPRAVTVSTPRVFSSLQEKLQFVAAEAEQAICRGQPLLIGTPSVRSSEQIGEILRQHRLDCQILHARSLEREAEIISEAGAAGRITIATNMAGRGTDIVVEDNVQASGGLQVLATELHSSVRIDRQLEGRTGRQGSRGVFQQIACVEDQLMEAASERERRQLQQSGDNRRGESALSPLRSIQKRMEQQAFLQRRQLLRRDAEHVSGCHRLGLEPVLEYH